MSGLNVFDSIAMPPGKSIPMVFFHGWGFDSQIWQSVIPKLQATFGNYQMILVDLPGCGQHSDLSWEDFKTVLFQEITEPFFLVGWSLGGLLATKLACQHPEKVLRVINITSVPYFIQDNDWPGISRDIFDEFYQKFSEDPYGTRKRFLQAQLLGHAPLDLDMHSQVEQQGLKEGLARLKYWDLRQDLKQLTCPVAYIFGRLDAVVPYKLLTSMQSQFPNFTYRTLKKAAHAPFLSHPDEFIQILRDILCHNNISS